MAIVHWGQVCQISQTVIRVTPVLTMSNIQIRANHPVTSHEKVTSVERQNPARQICPTLKLETKLSTFGSILLRFPIDLHTTAGMRMANEGIDQVDIDMERDTIETDPHQGHVNPLSRFPGQDRFREVTLTRDERGSLKCTMVAELWMMMKCLNAQRVHHQARTRMILMRISFLQGGHMEG